MRVCVGVYFYVCPSPPPLRSGEQMDKRPLEITRSSSSELHAASAPAPLADTAPATAPEPPAAYILRLRGLPFGCVPLSCSLHVHMVVRLVFVDVPLRSVVCACVCLPLKAVLGVLVCVDDCLGARVCVDEYCVCARV